MPIVCERMLSDVAADLHRAFVAAYRPYLLERLGALGIDDAEAWAEVIDAGECRLDEELGALLALPSAGQSRSPLEVFGGAVAAVTPGLAAAGVIPTGRDPGTRGILPEDQYGLAPASSRALGEEARRAHLAWGVAKARSPARPAVGLLSSDPMDCTRIEEIITASGFRLEVWDSAGAVSPGRPRPPVVAFVDLAHPDADEAIRLLAGRATRVVGYGPEVDDFAVTRARTLGASDALPRSVFFRSLRGQLPRLV